MTQSTSTQIQAIEMIMAELPSEKAQELVDFAYYLHQRFTSHPQRGSAAAILETMSEVGPLEFEEGELVLLLDEIEAMRSLDMRNDD